MISNELHNSIVSTKPFPSSIYYFYDSNHKKELENTLGVAFGSNAYIKGDVVYEPTSKYFYIIVDKDPALMQNDIYTWTTNKDKEVSNVTLYKVTGDNLNKLNRLYLINNVLSKQIDSILANTILFIHNSCTKQRNVVRYDRLDAKPVNVTISEKDRFQNIKDTFRVSARNLDLITNKYPEITHSTDIVNLIISSVLRSDISSQDKTFVESVVNNEIYPKRDKHNIIDYEIVLYTALGHILGLEKVIVSILDGDDSTIMPDSSTVDHKEVMKELLYYDGFITETEKEESSLEDIYDMLFERGVFFGLNIPVEVINKLHQMFFGMGIYV